jgi:glycosyltransferase involved in cell wall biosynthesis
MFSAARFAPEPLSGEPEKPESSSTTTRSMPRWRDASHSSLRHLVARVLVSKTAPEPRLVVDVQTAQGGFFGDRGIRRYALALTLALLRRGAVAAVLFNPNRPILEPVPSGLWGASQAGWNTTPTLRRVDAEGAAAYLVTSPFERVRPPSVLPQYVAESGMPVATVLYDLIPEIIDVYPPKLMAGYRARRELIKQMDLVLTISEHTRRDAIERLGMSSKSVVMIGAGASDHFRPPAPGDQSATLLAERLPAITKPFALSVSGWQAHKNTGGLIDAWARLTREVREAHQLVITCRLPPEAGTTWIDRARARRLRHGDIVVTDYVDDEVLRALYQQARLSVSPSFYEGFGLPALEAARCGCPVITSNSSSLPEVLQWPPATFPPEDADEMARVIERGLVDEAFRLRLRVVGAAAGRRHTWDRVVDRAISACTGLASSASRRDAKWRVALVDSSTRRDHAIRYVVQVARRLCDRGVHVDRFGERDDDEPRQRDLSVFGRTVDPWTYDAVVYVIDEGVPARVVDLVRRCPGILWFLTSPTACPDVAELLSAARARLVPPEMPAANGATTVAPFGWPEPTRVASPDEAANTAASLLDLIHALQ